MQGTVHHTGGRECFWSIKGCAEPLEEARWPSLTQCTHFPSKSCMPWISSRTPRNFWAFIYQPLSFHVPFSRSCHGRTAGAYLGWSERIARKPPCSPRAAGMAAEGSPCWTPALGSSQTLPKHIHRKLLPPKLCAGQQTGRFWNQKGRAACFTTRTQVVKEAALGQ